MKNKEI